MLYLNQHSVMCFFLPSASSTPGVYAANSIDEAFSKVSSRDRYFVHVLYRMPKRGCIIVVAPEEKMAETIRDPQTWDKIDACLNAPAHFITYLIGNRPSEKLQMLLYNRTKYRHTQEKLAKSHVVNLLAWANMASEEAPVLKGAQYA